MTLTAVFSEVLRMSLTAAAVILCILPVRLLLRRAPAVWRYALWAVVLFRLLCPVSIPASFAVLPPALHTGAVLTEWAEDRPVTQSADLPQVTPLPQEVPAAPAGTPVTPAPPVTPSPAADPLTVLGAVWLTGALGMLAYSAVSLARLRRRLQGAVLLRDNIRLCRRIDSPFVLGICRPTIYLPVTLSTEEQDYILLHEQFHIRHGDHIFRLLAYFALCLHWFNPLVWLAFVLAGRDMEMRCDEAVLKTRGGGIRADYSQSLLTLAAGRRLPVATPLAFGAGDTKSRIRNVLRWRRPSRRATLCALALCLLVTAACAVDPVTEAASDTPFGHAYAVEEITYQDGTYGFGYTDPADAPHYRISPDGNLLSGSYGPGATWQFLGLFRAHELTAEDFDTWITPHDPTDTLGAELRGDNAKAWRAVIGQGDTDVVYYLLQQENGDVYIAYGYEMVDYRNIRWIFKLRAESTVAIELYGAYVPNGCLYMNPLSSAFAPGGDDGNRYYINESGLSIDDRRGGVTVLDPIDWGWQAFPWTADEWDALFWDVLYDAPDLSAYDELLYQPLSDERCLVRADGDLWLVELRENEQMGRYVWSIFRLVPEEHTGCALWSYRRALNAPAPQFRFRFDLPYDEISAFCAEGQLENGDASGTLLTYAAGEALWWSPLDENGVPAESAVISFALQNGDAPTTGGTIYIERWGDSTKRPAYIARVVGAGLTLENADDGTAVIR